MRVKSLTPPLPSVLPTTATTSSAVNWPARMRSSRPDASCTLLSSTFATSTAIVRLLVARSARLAVAQIDSGEDDRALGDHLPVRRHVQQVEDVVEHADDEHTEEGARHRAGAADEIGASDEHGRHGVEREAEARTRGGIADPDAAGEDEAAEARQRAAHGVRDRAIARDGHARQPRRLLVAAQRVDRVTVHRA